MYWELDIRTSGRQKLTFAQHEIDSYKNKLVWANQVFFKTFRFSDSASGPTVTKRVVTQIQEVGSQTTTMVDGEILTK